MTTGELRKEWNTDWSMLRSAGVLCECVYLPDEGTRSDVFTVSSGPALARIHILPSEVWIVWRGTVTSWRRPGMTIRDWAVNLRFLPREDMHRGFLSEVHLLLPEIVEIVREHKEGRKIIIAGHSQGGSLAGIASVELPAHGFEIHRVFTFGAAAWAKRQMKAYYDATLGDRTWDIVNGTDPVTWVLRSMYKRVGRYTYLDREKRVWAKPPLLDFLGQIGRLNHLMRHYRSQMSMQG